MKEWFTAQELAGLPGMPRTCRNVRLVADRLGFRRQRRQKGKGWEYHLSALPPATQAELLRRAGLGAVPDKAPAAKRDAGREALWRAFEAAPQKTKDEAQRRAGLLRQVRRLIDNRTPVTEALQLIAAANSEAPGNLKRWYYGGAGGRPAAKDYDVSDWPAVLVPQQKGHAKTVEIEPEAWDIFKGDYLRLEAPALRACYERLTRIAKQHGWQLPSEKTFARKIQREIPEPVMILAREGSDALKRAYPAQQRDHAYFHAMQAVNADGHKFDVFVRWPDGEIGRPVAVVWQDVFSGKVLSWRVEKHESSDGYRLSFGDMVETYGVMDHVYLDNGRGIAAKYLTGGAPNRFRFRVREEDPVGIITQLVGEQGIHWCTPYHGQAKPIERAFRDWCEYVAKHPAFAGAYTGNKPDAKPENYASRAVPIEEFLRVLEQEVKAHNARKGRRSKVCNGRSFDDVFAESYAQSLIRKVTAEQRRLWLLAAEGVTANRTDGSVTLDQNRYWCDALAEHKGKKLIVRFDPDNLHGSVHCYTSDGRYIAEAECTHAAGFGDKDAAREHTRLRKQWINANKQQLERERRMNALDVAKRLPDQPDDGGDKPATKVVRPVFNEPRKRVANGHNLPDDTDERDQAFQNVVAELWGQKKSRLL